jgi:hypothetical protein
MPPVCAASGASRLQRAAHVTVPLARRDPTPTCHSLRRWLRRAGHLCVLRQRATITASQARFYAACATQPPPVGHSRRQDMRRACHLSVPHHARRDRSKQSTSLCRSRNVSPSPPATAGSVRVVRLADHFCVPHRRVAITASRARPRAARATGPSARLLWPAAGCAPGVPPVCASSGASRSQRAEHVLVPLSRCDPPLALHGWRRDVRWACHLCVQHQACRNHSEPRTYPCRSRNVTPRPPATACSGMCAGCATCVCHASALRSQRAAHVPVPLARCEPPPACHGRRRDVRRACHLCVPHPARRDYSDQSTSTCRSRRELPPACYGRRRDMRQAGHLSVPHRRVGIAASRACPRAARAP